jgi:hypothetical protein
MSLALQEFIDMPPMRAILKKIKAQGCRLLPGQHIRTGAAEQSESVVV